MKISTELQKKIKQLDKYENSYYNGKPLISDAAYDLFKDSVFRQLPPDHPRLSKVGHDPCSPWPKEQHSIFMGSQNKVSDEKAIRAWVQGVYQQLGRKNVAFVLQFKVDGFSLEAEYVKRRLDKGVTRGNGIIGENITPNVRLFRDVPGVLPIDRNVCVRGEGVLTKFDYDLVQKETGDHYKNPRNAASGISRRLDGSFSKYIRFIAYDVNAKVRTEWEKIKTLSKLGFRTVTTYKCSDIDEILKVYQKVKDSRGKLPFEIDGLVLKLDSIDLQEQLGVKKNRPEGQIALKFESDQAITTIKDVALQVGRTGKLTPVALLEPVDLMGSTVKKATLHNFDYIEQNFIGIGAEVTIEKKGDIIPQVVDIVSPGEDYKRPELCPSCGGSLVDDGTNMWCRNDDCKERETNRITYWIKVLDMKGFSARFVSKLWDLDKVRTVSDIYRLTPDDFARVDGIGQKTVKTFFKTLESSSEMYLERFITALGIPTCSKSTAEVLVENFGTWDRISRLSPADLMTLPGFAKTSATSDCVGIQRVASMAQVLLGAIQIKQKKSGPLTGKSFCVTGSLASMSRKQFQERVVDNGGTTKSGVGEGLTYLVTNDPNSGSTKNRKALKLGVKIISEDDFYKLLGKAVTVKKDTPEDKSDDTLKLISESLF